MISGADDDPGGTRPPRILLSLDPSLAWGEDLLQRILASAARSRSEVVAITVNETRYRELATFTFLREFGGTSADARPLDPERLDRLARSRKRRFLEQFEMLAQRQGVTWRLEEHSGPYPTTVFSVATDLDQLILAGGTTPSRRPRRRVVGLCNNIEDIRTTLAAASEYVEEADIMIGLIKDVADTAPQIDPDDRDMGHLMSHHAGLRVERIAIEQPRHLADFVRRHRGAMLILRRSVAARLPFRITALWEEADFPIALIT